MNRYDRQLRLWGVTGQQELRCARVLVVGDRGSSLCEEVLKNLSLFGIGEIHSVFSYPAENESKCSKEQQKSFFDKDRLLLLNKDVKWSFNEWEQLKTDDLQYWQRYSIVLVTTTNKEILETLISLWESNSSRKELPTLVLGYCLGMFGYVRLVSKDVHCIIESNPQHVLPDLKLDVGWAELDAYCSELQIESIEGDELAAIPYVVLLRLALMKMSEKPSKKKLKESLYLLCAESGTPGALSQCMNFLEAQKNAHLALADSTQLPPNVSEVIDRIPEDISAVSDGFNKQFWILVQALKKYYNIYGQLPLSGQIPDMESNTQRYAKLKAIYENKAAFDQEQFSMCLDAPIDKENISLFCRNLKNLRVVTPSNKVSPSIILDTLQTMDAYEDKAIFRTLIIDQFQLHDKNEYNKEIENLSNIVRSMAAKDLYSQKALIGGLVSQEVIKLLTHQHVPIENTYVYNGLENTATTFIL